MPEELKRSLGFVSIFSLIITSMIGTSLFFGIAAGSKLAGPASIIAWILMGIITIYVGACFGELIGMFPTSGGVYEFTKQAFGRFPSFLVGWITWIVANVGSAVLVVAAVDFLIPGGGAVNIAGMHVDYSLIKVMSAIVILAVFNYITYKGAKEAGNLLIIFTFVILALLIALILSGSTIFSSANYSGFAIKPLLILASVFFIAESFFGWEAASFLAEETKDPQRVIPQALLWASSAVVVLGVLFAAMMLGAFGSSELAQSENPVLLISGVLFPSAIGLILAGVFIMFVGGAIGNIVSSPRLLFALARDRLFIEQCTKLHPKYKTPVNAIIFQAVVMVIVVLIGFGSYQFLLSMLVPLALVMYGIVLCTIPILRKKQPHTLRPFRVWMGEWLPYVIAAFYGCVILAWALTSSSALNVLTLILGFLFMALPIYLFLTMVYNPDAIISVTNTAAKLNYALEDILFPRSVRKDILDLFRGHLRGKEVVEFGAGVGTFTMHLAEEVGPGGTVTAVDLSKNNLDIIQRRAERLGHKHVHTLCDEHQVNRLHPAIKHADVIYSVGFLGYVQDLRKVLREMRGVLSHHGKVCFVEYTNFFRVLPDPSIVADTLGLERTFREAGFAVNITKKRGLFWNYLIIHGIKTDTHVPYI